MLRGLGCRLGIDLFERGDIAPPRNFYAPLFQGAFGRKILPQPEPKPACVGTDDVVDLRVVTRRALKDCFSNGSFIDARVIPQQSLPTDVEEERGQAGGIEEATTAAIRWTSSHLGSFSKSCPGDFVFNGIESEFMR